MVMLSRSVVQKVSNLVFCAREPVRFTGITSGRIQRVNRQISYHSYNVQARSRVPGEIKRREVELDPQVSPEEIMNREVKLLSLRVVLLNSSATDIVLVTLPKHGNGEGTPP